MGLTGALYTGLSGMYANSEWITVSGNNIANVNTTSYKASRMGFETQISQLIRPASAPTENSGGVNASQSGLGVKVGSTSRNFNNGSLQPTGVKSDLAIQGDGFFIVDMNGLRRYTRDGNFGLDSDFVLVNSSGGRLQGYGVDSNFNIIEGVLGDLRIPKGISIAEATTTAKFKGNLDASGAVATRGSINTSMALYLADLTTAASATTALTALYRSDGTKLFQSGDVITLSGVTKGRSSETDNTSLGQMTIADHTFEVETNTRGADDSGTTLQDFLDFLEDVLGIDTSVGGGAVVNGTGQIVVTGNTGETNDLTIDNGDIIVNKGSSNSKPFTWAKTQDADGESVRTSFYAYDSLGTEVNLDLTMVLEEKSNTGTTWRFYIQSEDDSDLDRVVGNGTLTFDTGGKLLAATGDSISIDRSGTGAATPMQITLDFAAGANAITAVAGTSFVSEWQHNGSPISTLYDFAVGSDGTITGMFNTGLERVLGRIPLALFSNPQGLVDEGSNLFNTSTNSGTPVIASAMTGGAGQIVGGSLELSNVELSQEFINLINASTGFTANSRVISSSQQLIQELLATLR